MTAGKDQKAAKREMRRVMKACRAQANAKHPEASIALRDVFLQAVKLPEGRIIAGYVAHDSEIDPYPLLEALHRSGHKLCLPVVRGKGEPLNFRAYVPGDALIAARTPSIPEPAAKAAALEPDVILVPLLAFDERGHRLGWGEGHYDRTLTALRSHRKILAIGIGFDCQRVNEVPAGPFDAMLDKVITETQGYSPLKPS